MRDDLIPVLLKALGTEQTSRTDKVVVASCPSAPWKHDKGVDKHPSFAVWRNDTRLRCNCFSCDAPHNLIDLVWQMRQWNKDDPSGNEYNFAVAMALLEQKDDVPLLTDDKVLADDLVMLPPKNAVVPFPETYLTKFEDAYTEHEVHPYLASRGVSPTTARRLDIKWDAHDQRVCFPIRDFHGRLCGVHGRTVNAFSTPSYRVYLWHSNSNSQVWFGEHWLDFDMPVVAVESVFDLAAVYPIWQNVICPRMAGFPEAALKRLDGVQHIVTLADNDKAGKMFCSRFSVLKGVSVRHVSIAPYEDPGSAPFDFIREKLSACW